MYCVTNSSAFGYFAAWTMRKKEWQQGSNLVGRHPLLQPNCSCGLRLLGTG